jgi:hypothetical protein
VALSSIYVTVSRTTCEAQPSCGNMPVRRLELHQPQVSTTCCGRCCELFNDQLLQSKHETQLAILLFYFNWTIATEALHKQYERLLNLQKQKPGHMLEFFQVRLTGGRCRTTSPLPTLSPNPSLSGWCCSDRRLPWHEASCENA